MTYTVQIGHYIKILEDEETVAKLIGELFEKFEDDFFYCGDYHPNILFTNNIKGGTLFQGDRFCNPEEVEISQEDCNKSYNDFKINMLEIRKFLIRKEIKHDILFGAVSYCH